MKPFDLHTHTYMSDGTDSPRELVNNAKAAGLSLVAVTDHDTAAGVAEACDEGAKIGINVLPGIEFDVECEETALHILGLGIDTGNSMFRAAVAEADGWRAERNAKMLSKLRDIGVPIDDMVERTAGTFTRLHMANALVTKGFVKSRAEAFERYLMKGRPAFAKCKNIARDRVIEVIHAAGGVAVLAHPCKLKCDSHALIRELASYGLDGLEAFYPTSTDGQRDLFISLARQYSLLISAGSDYHGANRPSSPLGCAYVNDAILEPIFDKINRLL